MDPQYICENEKRADAIRNSSTLNGIDYIEVASVDQKTLELHFLHALPVGPNPPALTDKNIRIEGGTRITGIQAAAAITNGDRLIVTVNARGDFSFYTLRLVTSPTDPSPPAGFDPRRAVVEFSFKAGCPSEFDCRQVRECPPEKRAEPEIDYLAKDYASFRRLMLDRMSAITPDWRERNAADAHVAAVELLAYVGDQLSYYQDAVATEAYLGTARKRISVRRHARLLDYFMHDGSNARTWLFLEASAHFVVQEKTAFATLGDVTQKTALVFETMHDVNLWPAHNKIAFHTWSDTECCLPTGATRATLKNKPKLELEAGDLLLLEEIRDPVRGNPADVDPSHRHVVRLTSVLPGTDLVDHAPILDVAWDAADALPFPLCISQVIADPTGPATLAEISVARGNIVLADHGESMQPEPLGLVKETEAFRPFLSRGAIAQVGHARDAFDTLVLDKNARPVPFDSTAPAAEALRWEMRDTLPAVELTDDDLANWEPLADLLSVDPFARAFVVEIDESDRAQLRFGDDILGRKPEGNFSAVYRVGNGRAGNVGAETIVRALKPISGLASVRNPLPAQGGCDPESMEEVRQYAPQAFRIQERAVTEADWAEVAERNPEVQKAVARFRWTGSWTTIFLTIDRRGGAKVDAEFSRELRARLERYRIAGYDLEVRAPIFVPLDLALFACARPGYFASEVEKNLLAIFSNRDLPDGRRGFFHPDNFTFGQPVFLSQIYRLAMEQPGVASVTVTRFQRWGKEPSGEMDAGFLRPAAIEILRLDNDRNFPENGRVEVEVQGSL
ncbi:MAG TPA: baseplate J/gp47 family protein [Chthoniobacterales bacterium]|nr:baseplate J/gp47 family protein [Chthoniobacterales bacterium]